ncbi:MAG: DEAD/DEAH box helicase [Flavobacteriaceae bacterium]|nr:DEAD/DEAH box helicase [Flavobacteriaceae bacterium]
MTTFQELGLQDNLLKAITDLGFETPSEIQEKSIPTLLASDTDMVALAQTGTGKTAAFGFPLIQKINPENRKTQGLILSPTRELCMQIANELKLYSKYEPQIHTVAIYGGASVSDQASQIRRGAHIVVATPGRMQDMINRGLVDISHIDFCILDEADEMLNMGFYEDIKSILSHTPATKNTWLFSATMPKEVSEIAKKFMKTPVEITVGTKNSGSKTIEHQYYLVQARERYQALKRLSDANPDIFSLVFCRTKRDTQSVAEKLIEDGYNAAALHGDLSQSQRDLVMKSFRGRQIQMLVATDVAARGIDVDDITHVIHYQLSDEIETYTHRSGRTGRAGKTGISMAIITKSELRKVKSIERIIKQNFVQREIPTGIEICEIQLFHLANKVKKTEINHEIDRYLPAINELLGEETKEELIKKFFSVEFSRFFNYYQRAADVKKVSPSEFEEREFSNDGGSTRFFINLGERDGFDWMQLKDFLRDTLALGRDDLYKVDVKESFSFFNVDDHLADKVIAFFENFKLKGRHINVEVSKKEAKKSFGARKSFRGDRGGFQNQKRNDDFGKFGKKKAFDKKPGKKGFKKSF